MTDKELIESMAHKNGFKIVETKLREELSELQMVFARIDFNVINKSKDCVIQDLFDNMYEEIVDVEIMISQFKYFLKQGLYELKREEKLERIKQLLDADV